GAKLRRYQDLYDSCIVQERQQLFMDARQGQIDFSKYGVLNMLNTKYIIYGEEANNVIPNLNANGPAWFVKQVELVNSPNEELKKLREIDTRTTVVIDQSKYKLASITPVFDSLASVSMIDFKPSYLKYQSKSTQSGLAVFSEIYYPKGWKAFIDGKETTIFRANYVLRSLEVPAGDHTIEFKFEPQPYLAGNQVTLASSWIALLVMLGCVGVSLKGTLANK
ncbi:MAG: YfhO family protein, partial [Flammeovirgaceae bacterium]